MSIAYKNENRGKLLVAVMAMVMMFAGVVVLFSEESSAAPTDVTNDFVAGVASGTYVVDGDESVTLKDTATVEKAFTISGKGTLAITFTPAEKYDSAFVLNDNMTITGDVSVSISVKANGSLSDRGDGLTVFGGEKAATSEYGVTVSNGATLTVSQEANAHGASWRAGTLTVDNATVDFNAANSVGALDIVLKNGAELKFTNSNGTETVGNLRGTVSDSKVTVSSTEKALYLYNLTMTGSSKIDAPSVGIYTSQTVDLGANSSIVTKSLATKEAGSAPKEPVAIEGAGVVTAPSGQKVSITNSVSDVKFSFEGITVENAEIKTKITSSNGFTMGAGAAVSEGGSIDTTQTMTYEVRTETDLANALKDKNAEIVVEPKADGTAYDIDAIISSITSGRGALAAGVPTETVAGTLVIGENQSVSFDNVKVISASGNSKIVVYGTMTTDAAYIYVGVDLQDGSVYSASNTHKLTSEGTLNDSTSVGFGDELVLSGTIPAGVTVNAYGKLTITDLTVNGQINAYVGSAVDVQGKVVVSSEFNMKSGAVMDLSGSIDVRNDRNGKAAFNLDADSKVTVLADGSFTVYKPTSNQVPAADNNKLAIADGADFVVEGTLTVTGMLQGAVQDKGTVVFNGTAGERAGIVLYDGISVTIASVSGSIYITDSGIVADIVGSDKYASVSDKVSDGSRITLQNVRGVTVSETVTDKVLKNGQTSARYYWCDMSVTGAVSAAAKNVDASITVASAQKSVGINDDTRCGKVTVVETLGLGENVSLVIGSGSVLTVDGSVTAITKGSSISNSGTVTVNGTVSVNTSNAEDGMQNAVVNAAFYTVMDTDGVVTNWYSGFSGAVAALADANGNSFEVLGTVTTTQDDEIAAGNTVYVNGTLNIAYGNTLTVADGAILSVSGTVNVLGTLVITNADTGLSIGTLKYDVYTLSGNTATYTSLANALANSKAGDVITLSQDVVIRENMTIPEEVTVKTGDNKVTLNEGVVLTVDGTLAFERGSEVVLNDKASVIANGVISIASDKVSTALGTSISGAYFENRNVEYISNVEYAAANCNEGTITIRGDVAAGDVVFTAADKGEGLTVAVVGAQNDQTYFTFATAKLVGAKMTVDDKSVVSGKVTGASNGADATVTLAGASSVGFVSSSEDTVDGTVDYLSIYGTDTINNDISGKIEVSAGTVYVNDDNSAKKLSVGDTKDDVLTVASGATLVVPKNATLNVDAVTASGAITSYSGLVVDGTLQIVEGTFTMNDTGVADINGTMTVSKVNTGIAGVLNVTGALNIDTEDATSKVTVTGKIIVGTAPSTLGATASLAGTFDIGNKGFILAYTGSDLTNAKIEWNTASDSSAAQTTAFNVNGSVIMTAYADSSNTATNVKISDMTAYANVKGYESVEKWYATADFTTGDSDVNDDAVGDYDVVYATVEPSTVAGTISAGTGLDLYIDNIKWAGSNMELTLGEHKVSFNVLAGYDGSAATITFNGQTVANGGTIVVTEEGFVLVANGAVPSQGTVVVDNGGDSGMGLTDYLLIVLVVLIVIMAIIVAMRLMRS